MDIQQTRKRAQDPSGVAEAIRAATRSNVRGALEGLISGYHPIDIAFAMGELEPEERSEIFKLLNTDEAGIVLEEARDDITADLAQSTDDVQLAEIIDAMPPDAGADVMDLLDDEQAHRVLSHIPEEESDEIEALRRFPEGTAGALMNSDLLLAPEDLKAWELVAHIRNQEVPSEVLNYVYVVNNEINRRLVGVVEMRDLVIARPDRQLRDFMEKDLVMVHPEEDQEVVVRMFDDYDLTALPVVDDNDRLMGVITVDDAIDALQEEHTEDISTIAGTSSADLLSQSPVSVARMRLPWLIITFMATLVSAFVVEHLGSDILAKYISLAAFIPVNNAMAGNAGLQSSTIMVRAIALGHARGYSISRLIIRQMGTTIIIAIVLGLLAGFAGTVMLRQWELGIVVGASMLIAVSWATMIGVLVPLVFGRLNLDPAVSSGPLVTTANDTVALLIYFGVATVLLMHLNLL